MNPQLQITLNQSESIIISLSQHSVTHPQVRIIPTVFCAYELDLCQGRLDLWQDGRKAEKYFHEVGKMLFYLVALNV